MDCPDWLLSRPIAHRGLHSAASGPENSLAAFEAAAAYGCPIELDVQMSADGELIVFHDYTLERATDALGNVNRKSARELQSLSLFGTSEKIPLLKEVFSTIAGRIPILIEVKNEMNPGEIEPLLGYALRDYRGECATQSFNPYTVKWFRKNFRSIPAGLLSGGFKSRPDISSFKKFVLTNALLAPFEGPTFLAYELGALTPLRKLLFTQAYRLPLIFWTIRSAGQARIAREMGGNIIFENFTPT
jgi:glycerophosphoryl diester phosphodiesterase